MLNQLIFIFLQRIKAQYAHSMGGQPTVVRQIFRWLLFTYIWSSAVALGFGILVATLSLANASQEVGCISIFAYLVTCYLYGLTGACSRLVEDIANFFEGGIVTKVNRRFRQPYIMLIIERISKYTSPVLGVPTAPPRSNA